jgi:hypothetical protein
MCVCVGVCVCVCVYGGEVVQRGYGGVANPSTPVVYNNNTTLVVIDVINGPPHIKLISMTSSDTMTCQSIP